MVKEMTIKMNPYLPPSCRYRQRRNKEPRPKWRRVTARNNKPHRGADGKNSGTIGRRTVVDSKKPTIDLTEAAAQKPKRQRRAAVTASRSQEKEEKRQLQLEAAEKKRRKNKESRLCERTKERRG
ncbi:hypothetical protein M9H77_04283 [Catharanthus roseus]|uniref:Uncharacterized protein n=1 Tax=Catharanthus roseus TaxID=4058 RepID=A0ACC0CDT7_CATRO|nr:hypothetical protein M9H77_04283 [Catharanthus roseus]